MREFLESQFGARIVQWAEPTDDFGGQTFSAVCAGRLIVAESLALLVSALQDRARSPIILLAA